MPACQKNAPALDPTNDYMSYAHSNIHSSASSSSSTPLSSPEAALSLSSSLWSAVLCGYINSAWASSNASRAFSASCLFVSAFADQKQNEMPFSWRYLRGGYYF
jgi:hypothetical protein